MPIQIELIVDAGRTKFLKGRFRPRADVEITSDPLQFPSFVNHAQSSFRQIVDNRKLKHYLVTVQSDLPGI